MSKPKERLYRPDPHPCDLAVEMKAFAQRLSENPEEAKRFLIGAGILDSNGELAKPYLTPSD